MRSQLTIAGLQPAALTEKIAQAVGKPGAGEYLGDKVVDALTTPIQELRSRFRPTIRAGLPFVSHDRPLFKETFTQERQRQRHMDIAERQARATAAQITEHELSQAAVRAPRVAAMRNATQRQAELERAITRAFNSGDNAGKKILNARLTQIFGGRNLPVQGENFLREMSPGASRGGEGVVANVLRGNEILNKGWQTKHLLASPGFTIRNVAEDFSKMIAGRVTPSDLWDSASTVRAAEKGNLVAKARLQRIIDSGVDLGDSLRQDFSRLEGRHEAERKMAALYNAKVFTDPGALAALDRGVSGLSVINEKLPAWTLMNRKALNKWEKIARTAMWERSVAQGLPDVLAAERQAKLLFDYGRRFGPNDRYIKNVFSFVPYKTQAPAAAAQLLAENPAAVNAMLGIGRAMEPRYRKGETQAPEWQSRMGVTMRMPNALTDLRRMGVRDPKSAIMDGTYGILPIAPINELVQPLEFGEAALSGLAPGMSFRDLPGAAAEGGLAIDDEFMKNLLPNLQDIAEPFVLKRRILTGEPIKKGNEVPELLSRVLGRFSPSQGLDLAIERGLNAHNDAAWPDRFIGRYDKEALDAYNDLPFWAMNQFFPGKLTQPTHTQRLKNLTNSRDLAKVRAIFEVDQDDKPTREIKKEFQR
jgi:hypothetical protein